MAMPTFDDGLKLLSNVVRAPAGTPSGCSADEIATAEARLSRPLPSVLKKFLLAFGNLDIVMSSHDRITRPADLKVADGGLKVCEEHQDQMYWVVKEAELVEDDPQVWQRQPETSEWFDERAPLSLFLICEAAWQLVNGLPSTAVTELDPSIVKTLRQEMTLAAFKMAYGTKVYVDSGRGIVSVSLIDPMKVYVGAHDDESIEGLQERTGLEFDFL